ncbi:MAG: hypothetical protein CVV49_18380 [Spirochaetae bacterium HGW-Spirochaetae-5]|nr:MAG: hypothetical protein CVV49_18380 [Spirochaetae bacterium HGW-Spirochaetae-5]
MIKKNRFNVNKKLSRRYIYIRSKTINYKNFLKKTGKNLFLHRIRYNTVIYKKAILFHPI